MEAALIFIFALLGTTVGSFLNVCIDRLPIGKSIIYPPSHCDTCQHPLTPIDLIPIFSYLWLRRRCRYCQALIPFRPLWVEIGSGGLFALAYWHFSLGAEFAVAEFAVAAFYGSVFLVLGVIDLEHGLILNKITYPIAIVALITGILLPQVNIVSYPWPDIANGVIGGIIGFVFLLIPALISREGMGWGDVKMAGLIGLVTGYPLVLVALLMAVILGGLIASVLLLFKRKGRKEAIPFGPFLSLAAIATLLWGNAILSWYLGMF